MDRTFVRGNLNLLILSLLHSGPLYGLQVAKQINALIDDGNPLSYGSLYPALHRLETQGFLLGTDRPSPAGARPVREYALTDAGRAHLADLKAAQQDFQRTLTALWGEG
ncbi:PadR family transcriptional regulator [Deinococcus budaensis]|uniref:DNA-binding PadR family transcriptional regulator n=1 Tax=Deinococcus budaensis TaxID=1665626 RepID=A0A7W8LQ58_9DEIO|nr:PadR family transcriptional regulator [Deinococcus budaensis]MBB5234260.1 DNA-binding PadR family transcriptional regulator [Deinococcus budaensis]